MFNHSVKDHWNLNVNIHMLPCYVSIISTPFHAQVYELVTVFQARHLLAVEYPCRGFISSKPPSHSRSDSIHALLKHSTQTESRMALVLYKTILHDTWYRRRGATDCQAGNEPFRSKTLFNSLARRMVFLLTRFFFVSI